MAQPDQKKVRIKYHKGRHHRTFHADGAFAAVTPQEEIQVSFFSDIRPLPDEVTHLVTPEGGLGEEVDRQMEPVIVRETDVTVIANKEGAKSLIELLQRMIKQIEDYQQARKVASTEKPIETQEVS